MKSPRGSSLRAIPVAPGTEATDAPPDSSPNQNDPMTQNSGIDDLWTSAPDAPPEARPIAPNSPTQSDAHSDDLNWDDERDVGGQLGHVYDAVAHGDPDHIAKVLDASKKLGQEPIAVAGRLKDAEKAANGPDGNFFQSIEDRFPGTTQFLKKPENMAVAHDDIPNIAKHEQLVEGITQAMDLSSSFKAGFQGSVMGMTSRQKMPNMVVPTDAPIWNRLAGQAGGLLGDTPTMVAGAAVGADVGASTGAVLGGVAGAPFAGVGAIPGAMAGAAVGGLVGGGAGAFAAPAAAKELLRQKFEDGDIKGVADAMDRGGKILNAATKQGLVGGLTSVVGGAVGLPFESAAARMALPSVFGSKILKVTAPLVAENVTMTKAGNAVEGKETNPQDYLDNALVIAAMHGATHLGGTAAEHYVEAKKAQQAVQFYDGIGEAGGASKLLKRLQPAYHAMLGGLTEGSAVENIHIPQEAFQSYFQSQNIDPAQAAEDLGVTESYNASVKNPSIDVAIPTADFVSKIVKTEHYKGLRDDIKFDPDGFTVNEIKERQADIQEQIKAIEAKALAGGEDPISTPEESSQKIQDMRAQQLIATGIDPKEAQINALIHARAFNSWAEKLSKESGNYVDPHELAKKFQLEIQRREGVDEQAEVSRSKEGGQYNQDGEPINGKFTVRDDMPENVKVLRLPESVLTEDRHQSNEAAQEDAVNNHRNKSIRNGHTGDDIKFPKDGFGEIKGSVPTRVALTHIDELMKEAVFDVREANKKKPNIGIKGFDRYYAPMRIGDKEYLVRIKTRETKEGKRFYHEVAIESEHPAKANPSGEMPEQPKGTMGANPISEVPSREENQSAFSGPSALKIHDMADQVNATREKNTYFQSDKSGVLGKESPSELVDNVGSGEPGSRLALGNNERNEKSVLLDSLVDRSGFRAKRLTDLLESYAASMKERGLTETPSLFAMLSHMDAVAAEKSKILDAVIGSVPIDVMNDLFGSKRAAKKALHDETMLQHSPAFDTNLSVAERTDTANAVHLLVSEAASTAAKLSDISFGSRSEPLEGDATTKARVLGQGDGPPRARITFTDHRAIIELFKDANRSSFLHESGHYFLEIMQHLASEESAPQSIKNDLKAIRDWMGLKDGDVIGKAQHEQWARGFEAYLMEGKAPSEALRPAFARFKQWLVEIYRSARGLHVQLSPEIREVMDRMLATDDEIKAAQKSVGFDQNGGKEVPPHMLEKMNSLSEQARDKAESTLMREQMKETSDENKKFLAAEKARLQSEAEEKISNEPVFKAQNDIQEAIGSRRKVLGLAEKMVNGSIKSEDQAHFEIAAEVNGFHSGEDLANQMLSAEANGTKQKMTDAHVEEGMKPHANLMDKSEIKLQALKAIHNDHMTELLALERQIFASSVNEHDVSQEVSRRQRVEARIAAVEAKAQAKEILGAKSVKDAGNFQIYVTAERNAAIKADAASRRKDFTRASEYKRQQMLNHALAAEAMRNRDEIESAEKYLNKRGGDDLKNIPYAFNKQIDQLLERFGVKEKSADNSKTMMAIAKDMQGKGESQNEIANATGMIIDQQAGSFRPETLRDFINRQNEEFHGIQLPDSVLSGNGADNYQDLKMSDLRDLKDAVKTLMSLGRQSDRFLNGFIQVGMGDAAKETRKSIEDLIGAPFADERKIGTKYKNAFQEQVARIKNLPSSMMPSMVNTLTIATYLDGGEASGPAKEYIYRPLKQAEDRKFARYAKMREEIAGKNGLLSKFYEPKELAGYKEKAEQLANGQWVTKENILSMALNWGNEANQDRIRAGFGSRDKTNRLIPMSDKEINGLFDRHLKKKDWDFAQATWDHLETYWPEIAALEMKVKGVEPERVEPAPFENQHGSYAGGYYPISYDFAKSDEAYKTQQALTEEFQQYSAAAAHTNRGHAIARVAFVARPIRLSLDVLFNHLENVIHDLEFRPAVIDTAKFLNMPDVKTALQNSLGLDGYRGLNDWLKSLGSAQGENLTWIDKALQWSRFGTTIATLGLTPKAFLLHLPSNVFNSMWETGVQNTVRMMTRASLDVAMGRGDLKEFVFERSERMKQRLTVRDRDIMEMSKAWQGTAAGVIPQYAFMSLHLADEAVSVPLWADVYKRNVAEFGEAKAKELADETVTRTLGSGSKVDQIGFQRGGPKTKLFTMFYSWMSVMFNRAWLDGKVAGLEYKNGNVGSAAAILAKATFFAWALPAVHEALLQEAMHNGPSTDDERKKRMAGAIISHPFAMIPFVRDIAQPAIHTALGEHGGDMKISPVEQAYQNLYKPVADGINIMFNHNKHVDEKYAEEVARGMSQAAGYPQQLNTWAFNFLDYVNSNGEASMKDFLSRRHKK